MIRVLFIGDIVGKPGRQVVKEGLPYLMEEFSPHLVIANGENAAGGNGLTPQIAEELFDCGVHILTGGNHIWKQKEIMDYIVQEPRVLRPANYPPGVPGNYSYIWEKEGVKVAVLNLLGRVFMDPIDCPFRRGEQEVANLSRITSNIIVDFHAEATSEKVALGWFLEGKVSAVCGTHTHVQTADERVLPRGTAYITDVGMSGAFDSVIGVEKEAILKRFLTGLPVSFEVAKKDLKMCGVKILLDELTGKALDIKRFQYIPSL
jgi:hypothetical protein